VRVELGLSVRFKNINHDHINHDGNYLESCYQEEEAERWEKPAKHPKTREETLCCGCEEY